MIRHHPVLATLRAYATGDLPEALGLVVSAHATYCPACRWAIAACEADAGRGLAADDEATLSSGAWQNVLHRLDGPVEPVPPVLHPSLPPPLDRVPMGRWWPVAPGVRWRRMHTGGSAWAGLLLLEPNRSLPPHSHAGRELTCVLAGCFSDGAEMFHAGDIAEPESDHDRPLVVVGNEPCLCVLSSEGLRLKGLFGAAQRVLTGVARQAGLMRCDAANGRTTEAA